LGSASSAKSGVALLDPHFATAWLLVFWALLIVYTELQPPPLPDQADSEANVPSLLVKVVVPPTATTFGEDAGYPAGCPSSPVAAKKETPLERPVVNMFSENEDTLLPSEPPQLMDTMGARVAAVLTAGYMSALLGEFAHTKIILAAGAIEWTHCTSRFVSPDQVFAGLELDVSSGGMLEPPFWSTFLKHPLLVVQAGRLNLELKVARSFSTEEAP